ncbi:MAG TPA: sodium:solute symporter [Hyphomicrobiaceae bacterium]|nr:sodium:solute symporter [Hyphomicrobiaceae bacterium]
MTTASHGRLVNPRLGTYFGIFASLFTALVVLLLIFEQLGAGHHLLRWLMLLGPIALFAAIGVGSACREPIEYFASGRRVPSVYCGLGLAASATGGTGMVAFTGLFFLNGFDAWCLVMGLSAGFVVMALGIAPYLRKVGAFTLPSYLGRRFESRLLRVASAAMVAVPMMLVIIAEVRMGAWAASLLSGQPETSMIMFILLVTTVTVLFGGMRALTWSNTAQEIASLLALLVPVGIVAAIVTNLPLPQLSHGPVLRAIGRAEFAQGVPIAIAPSLAFDFAGRELQALVHRMAEPYGSVGPLSFILAAFTVMTGVAAAPWLLPRCGATPGVYDTRKAVGWATVFCGIITLTVASVAVFLRDAVMDELVGRSAAEMPTWFLRLQELGWAGVEGNAQRLALSSFSFKRDTVLFALPHAAGLPTVLVLLALAGAVAAALIGASAGAVALANVLAEDILSGTRREPPPAGSRVMTARLAVVMVAVAAGTAALLVRADPLSLLLWALALSGSAAFPVLVLSVWWKRTTAFGALSGMAVGFAMAVVAMLAGEAGWLGVPAPLAAVFGVPAGFGAAVLASRMGKAPERLVLELVRDMRLPGGETIHDREMRLLRLQQRQQT